MKKADFSSAASKQHIPYASEDVGYDPWISTDPFGSYTGLIKDTEEKPVQDADDL